MRLLVRHETTMQRCPAGSACIGQGTVSWAAEVPFAPQACMNSVYFSHAVVFETHFLNHVRVPEGVLVAPAQLKC